MALAALVALRPGAERVVSLLALIVFCLPLVATGPILRVLYGPGTGPQVTLAALAVFYTTYLPLRVGLRAAPRDWFDLVASYGRGRGAALLVVRAPASLPYLAAGLQIAAPAALLGAMVGEFTGAERGLGVLILRAIGRLDTVAVWGLAAVSALVAMAGYAAFGGLMRWLAPGGPPVLTARPPGVPRSAVRRWGEGAVAAGLVLLLWWGAMEAAGLDRFFARRPLDVAAVLLQPEPRAALLAALGQTLATAVPGYLAGLALGGLAAVLLVLRPGFAPAALPVAVALRADPVIATAPVLVLALGRGAAGSIAIVALMTFFPTLVAMLHGLSRAPRAVLDLFDSYAAPPGLRLRLAQLPAALPAGFAAARMAVPAAVLAATTAEWLATGRGIGALMAVAASTSAYGLLWAGVVVLTLAALAGHALVAAAERRVLSRYAREQLDP